MVGLTPKQISSRRRIWILFKLRARLAWRQYTAQVGKLIGALLGLIFLLPLTIGIGIGTAAGYRLLPAPWPQELLIIVLTIIWLIWIVYPIMVASLNQALDPTRLLIYPIPKKDLIISNFLGTLLDTPTFIMAPLLISALISWGLNIAFPLVLLALILAYLNMVVISQTALVIFGGIVQSRRFRDIFIIVLSTIGMSCYLIQVAMQKVVERISTTITQGQLEQLAEFRPSSFLQWLPPGASARAIIGFNDGAWGVGFLWLTYALVILAIGIWIWWRLLERLLTGEGFLIQLKTAKPEAEIADEPKRQKSDPWRWLNRFSPATKALVSKELKAIWRTPQRRILTIQGAIMPVFMVIPLLTIQERPSFALVPDWVGITLPIYIMFLYWMFTTNMLGWEHRGLPALLLTPVDRTVIFRAKSLALTLVGLPIVIPIAAIMLYLTQTWITVAGILYAIPLVLILLASSAWASAQFPYPVQLESKLGSSNNFSGSGCLSTFANFLLVPVLEAILAMPLMIALIAAYWFELPWLAFVLAPIGFGYGWLLFWHGTQLAGERLLAREAEVLEAARPKQPV